MLQPVHHSPAVPAASTSRGVAVRSNADSALRPHAVTNAAADASVILMCGMPCYGEHAPPGIGNVLSAPERFVIEADYRRHRGYLNNPEYLFNLDAGKVPAHAAYRVLCTQFQRPGSFAIRQAEQGAFMLVHRSQRTPQLVRTALEHSDRGWHLHVADTANSGWNGVRGRHFETLDALKGALPPGMHEVAGASLHDLETTHL